MIPTHPKFFTMYRTEAACERNAERWMEGNKKGKILVNARCADSTDPALVPYLRNVQELESDDKNDSNENIPV